MKTILVPVDYSNVSDNALHYAIELAMLFHSKLVIFHMYSIPVPNGEMPILLQSDMQEEENQGRIKSLEEQIRKRTKGKIEITGETRAGFNLLEEIKDQIGFSKADLVVIGITGNAGMLSQTLIGSNAVSMLRHASCPILVIPEKAHFRKLETIVLACDYNSTLPKKAQQMLALLLSPHKGKLAVLHVQKPMAAIENEFGGSFEAIHKSLSRLHPEFFHGVSEDLDEEIRQFSLTQKADMLVMIPHKHNFFERLFRGSNTQKTAFHTTIPLLSIHD